MSAGDPTAAPVTPYSPPQDPGDHWVGAAPVMGALADSPEWNASSISSAYSATNFGADIERQRGVAITLARSKPLDVTAADRERRNIEWPGDRRQARSGQFIRPSRSRGSRRPASKAGFSRALQANSQTRIQLAQKLIDLTDNRLIRSYQMRSAGTT